ncbi:hypothetical protein A0256_17135 [Mucilaginibacter sp. PAMC 26640]|nr:hypothetical protein A0256_17135 [Mucilaginibacter sp. PAMC 26640]
MLTSTIIFIFILLLVSVSVYALGKLTLAGTITGALTAISLYLGFLFAGLSLLGTFFILATLATWWQKRVKAQTGNFKHPEKRNAYQVVANGGIAAFFGLLNFYGFSYYNSFATLAAAALASATADTLSSEMGTVYGKRFYNVITFKTDLNGRDGVISLEGTLIGIAGSVAIALVFSVSAGFSRHSIIILIAGTAGNLFDSVLGATLERKGYIKNNIVNFLNTAFAALLAYLILLI